MSLSSDTLPVEIDLLNKRLFTPCALLLKTVTAEPESQDYLAHRLTQDNKEVAFRKAKITPTKVGQFVTLWKRNSEGITSAYHIADQIDYAFIFTQTSLFLGVFVFPKELLRLQGIFSDEKKEGKRGFRVYPIWDKASNKQAQKTQSWQLKYFINLTGDSPDIEGIKPLFKL